MVRQRTEVGTRIARARGADLAAVLRTCEEGRAMTLEQAIASALEQ